MSENISGCLMEFFPYFDPFASQLDGIFFTSYLETSCQLAQMV